MAGAGEDLELLFHAEKTNFLSRNDALVLALHSILLDEGARCVGKGDQWHDDEKGSKTLPRLWNEDQEKFSLRYVIKNNIKILLSVIADHDNTMITITEVSQNKTEGLCLNADLYVSQSYEIFESAFKDLDALRKRLKEDVLAPILAYFDKESKFVLPPRRMRSEDDYSPLMVPGPRPFSDFGPSGRPVPFDYGRSDLDPFGGRAGMGGMLFDIPRPNRNPPIPGNFPRGSVPPGARFDPIGPSSRMPNPGPMRHHPDVGLPPGFDDDMFL